MNRDQENSTAGSHPTTPRAKRMSNETAIFLIVLLVLSVGFGYRFGKDLAEKHNRADCIAAGLAAACQGAPKP